MLVLKALRSTHGRDEVPLINQIAEFGRLMAAGTVSTKTNHWNLSFSSGANAYWQIGNG